MSKKRVVFYSSLHIGLMVRRRVGAVNEVAAGGGRGLVAGRGGVR
jgi:hypothetical protein